jgi:hypothetical protein
MGTPCVVSVLITRGSFRLNEQIVKCFVTGKGNNENECVKDSTLNNVRCDMIVYTHVILTVIAQI